MFEMEEVTGAGGDGKPLKKSKGPEPATLCIYYLNNVYPVARDEISKQIVHEGEPMEVEAVEGLHLTMIEDEDYRGVTDQLFKKVLRSNKIQTVNPVRFKLDIYLLSNPAGSPGIFMQLARTLNLSEDSPMTVEFIEMIFRKWFVGLVAMIYDKGAINMLFPILTGPIQIGKSKFCLDLLPKFITESYLGYSKLDALNPKDDTALLVENIVLFLDEVELKEAARIRWLLSSPYFNYRPPFMPKNIKLRRFASFIGTSNDKQIIPDAKNNRRIVPIDIVSYDFESYNKIPKEMLLVEALRLFNVSKAAGRRDWELTRAEVDMLTEFTQANAIRSEAYDICAKYVKSDGYLEPYNATEICAKLQERVPPALASKLNKVNVGKAMAELGFTSKSIRLNGSDPKYAYMVRFD